MPSDVNKPTDNLGANKYLYIRNNPINKVDPEGVMHGKVRDKNGNPLRGVAVRIDATVMITDGQW